MAAIFFVDVRSSSSKLWRYAYKFDGKQMALGAYPEISFANARALRTNALLRDGVDPMQQAKVDKLERQALTEDTFCVIAAELLEKNQKEGLAEFQDCGRQRAAPLH